jgi:hypothetical protein
MSRPCKLLLYALLGALYCVAGHGESAPPTACALFAPDGAVATGTIRDQGRLEIKLSRADSPVLTATAVTPAATHCELAFSADSKWLAALVPAAAMKIVFMDRAAGTTRQFSIPEPVSASSGHGFRFRLSGFLPDGSLALLMSADRRGSVRESLSREEWFLERYSMEGTLLSHQSLGVQRMGGYAFGSNNLDRLWIPGVCNDCFRELALHGNTLDFIKALTLPNNVSDKPAYVPERDLLLYVRGRPYASRATVTDLASHKRETVSLRFFPNLLVPFAVDSIYAQTPVISGDGKIAVIARSRSVEYFIDTEHDWGSEFTLLDLNPLRVITTYRTGPGNFQTIAIDHRGDTIRVVGHWHGSWHDLRWDQRHPGKWKETPM